MVFSKSFKRLFPFDDSATFSLSRVKADERDGADVAGDSVEIGGISKDLVITISATLRIPCTTSKNAKSRSDHVVIGLPPVGRAWSLPSTVPRHSTGRRIMGITN